MKSIRSQLAGEMTKGSIQKVKLPNKESASMQLTTTIPDHEVLVYRGKHFILR